MIHGDSGILECLQEVLHDVLNKRITYDALLGIVAENLFENWNML
jgi:hypothetical protein